MLESKIMFVRKSVFRRFVDRTFKGEKMNLGFYMFAAQRVTGAILLFYFFLHLYTLSSIFDGPATFDRTMARMDNPIIRLLELALLWTVVFHAFNGIRLILINLFIDVNQKALAIGLSLATVIFIIISVQFV